MARSNWLLSKLKGFYHPQKKKFSFQVFGRIICAEAWRALHDVKKTRFYDIRSKVINGDVVIVHGNALRTYPSPKYDLMVSWLKMSVELYCEWVPHLQLVCFPYGVDRVDWYKLCVESLTSKWTVPEEEVPSLTYFYGVLSKRFPYIKTSRRLTLGRCMLCVLRKLKLQSKDLSKEERNQIQAEGETHLRSVMDERNVYSNVSLASRNPDNNLMSIILDKGNGPRIPHLAQHPKNWNTMSRFKTSLFVFINHGKSIKCLIPFLSNFPDDPNFVISLLYHQLLESISESEELPENFHGQTDNCSKENKNQWMNAFNAVLVGLRIFKNIEWDQLPAGHTHLDVDAALQPVSVGATKFDCITPSEFPQYLAKCYKNHKNQPKILSLPTIYDWKTFLHPMMRDTSGITGFRSFKFQVRSLNANYSWVLHIY